MPSLASDLMEYNYQFEKSNVVINARANEIFYPKHWTQLSLKCAFGGAEHYQCSNGRYAVDADRFLILNKDTTYSSWISSPSEVESLTVNFTSAFQSKSAAAIFETDGYLLDHLEVKPDTTIRFVEKLYSYDSYILNLLHSIKLAAADASMNELRLQNLFFELYVYLVSTQSGLVNEMQETKKRKDATRKELYQRLVRARDFMYSCYPQHLSLSDIADVACLNPYYFLREFKRAFSITPHQYLTERRMLVAKRLLKESNTSISEICLAVGYEDLTSFSKLFKKVTGRSPMNFRELNGKLCND